MTTAPAEACDAPLLHAWRVRDGAAARLDWPTARAVCAGGGPEAGWAWLHLDRGEAQARAWVEQEAGLGDDVREAMLSDDTRPRAAELDGGLVLILRGPNRDAERPFQSPVSVRLFIDAGRVISVRLRPFAPTYDLDQRLADGWAPETPGAFLEALVQTTLVQIEAMLDEVAARFDRLEDLALSEPSGRLRHRRGELNRLKRGAIVTKRYLRPQAGALERLATLGPDWLDREPLQGVREAADQTARIVDDLEELRERAGLIGEEMQARLNDRMNRTMVALTTVSTLFLPMSVVAGLFGANLAGIPFAERPWSFGALAGFMVVVAAATAILIRTLNRG